jgi:hypothetical protein
MTNKVQVPFGENPSETATLLLAAAEELGIGQSVVGTIEGAFLVPPEVADRVNSDNHKQEATPKPAKKAAAKKTAAKKKG